MKINIEQGHKNILNQISKEIGKNISFFVEDAVRRSLEDLEDGYTALYVANNPSGETTTLEELRAEYDLVNSI